MARDLVLGAIAVTRAALRVSASFSLPLNWIVEASVVGYDASGAEVSREPVPVERPVRDTAFVVGFIDTVAGTFAGCGVFSEETPTVSLKMHPFTILRGRGRDYQEGLDSLHAQLTDEPRRAWAWVVRHLDERARASLDLKVVHFALKPFQAVCGADEPNQSTTTVQDHATCKECREVPVAEESI